MDTEARRSHDAGVARLAEDLTSVEGHVVQFYEGDHELTSAVARFAGAGLAAREGVLVVATAPHRRAFEAALRDDGRDLEGYVTLDADETLARVIAGDGRVDASRFCEVMGDALTSAADAPGGHVRVFGELVALLCAAGDADAAMELEGLWNELAAGPHRFSLLCAYPLPPMDDATGAALFYEACSHHSAVVDEPGGPLAAWCRFESTPLAIGAARRFVARTLERWGCGNVVEDAAVVVSELATNAVLHARSAFHVSIDVVDEGIRIAVHDDSPIVPTPREYSETSATGRGLRMVDALAARWGTVPRPDRKTVWAELSDVRP